MAKKAYWKMTAAELARATKAYNRPIPLSETRPLTPKMRRKWERAMGPGRPKIGEGAKPVLVTIEGALLRRADAYAKRKGITRAELVARGLKAVLPKSSSKRGAA